MIQKMCLFFLALLFSGSAFSDGSSLQQTVTVSEGDKSEVLFIAWGKGPDEISLISGDDPNVKFHYGAAFLGQDNKNNVYVYDLGASTINKFDRKSKKTQKIIPQFIAEKSGSPVRADFDHDLDLIYFNKGNQFEYIDKNGTHFHTQVPDSAMAPVYEGKARVRNGKIVNFKDSQVLADVLTFTAGTSTGEISPAFWIKDFKFNKPVLEISDLLAWGFRYDKLDLILKFRWCDDVRFEGSDSTKNLYFLLSIKTASYHISDQDYYLLKVGYPDCAITMAKMVSSESEYKGMTNFAFDRKIGAVLEAVGGKKGISILEWRLR